MIGIKKSAYYNKVNGLRKWTLDELIMITELSEGEIDINVSGKWYRVIVRKKIE